MDIIIHTLGRATLAEQHTLRQLLAAGIKPTLVVQDQEFGEYAWYDGPVYRLPPYIKRLAETRDYIIHDMLGSNEVVFLDDDLHFAVRRDDDATKFRQPEPEDIRQMFKEIDSMLRRHSHVGIGAREGGNRVTEPYLYNTRIMRVLAYRRDVLKKECITFTPLVVMEDFHVNLQLLRAGYDTVVCNDWVSNQAGGSDAAGGCSTYRSSEVQTASAHLLAEKHRGFVRVVEKTTKGAWGGGTRTDVVIQWKKARASGDA